MRGRINAKTRMIGANVEEKTGKSANEAEEVGYPETG